MLRAVSTVYIESQSLLWRDVLKFTRLNALFSSASGGQTVLSNETVRASGAGSSPPPPPLPPPPQPPRPPRSRRAWTAAAALALTASVGGVYFYRKLNDDVERDSPLTQSEAGDGAAANQPVCESIPARAEELPDHVQYLLVGGGTAAFAAMRAIRSARPDAQVLIVSDELALPYMRPPLSKELWREPDLALRALRPDELTFRQWNGRRRSVTYEPSAFYTPPERLREGGAGAGLARGWRVLRVDPERHLAELAAPGAGSATITYDKCLIATGVRPRRLAALSGAAAAGRALTLRSARDAARLAAALDDSSAARVLVVGGGFLATELSAALADRLRGSGRSVRQVFREEAPLAHVLPRYLAIDAARRLQHQGVELLPHTEITESEVRGGCVRLRRTRVGQGEGEGAGEEKGERELEADLVVECVGCEPDDSLALASGLELHPEFGGFLVNAELQARTDLWVAGDAASFHDTSLGRRRVEHHDHAVASGRLAGENMAALRPARPYTHQSMFWSDVGPQLGYEAVGIIDSRLPTVGVFSADAVSDVEVAERLQVDEPRALAAVGAQTPAAEQGGKQFERGVVFYLREERVVGVLLWNLFNRMHVARQVLTQGKFDDLFEAAKLFTPHEED